jgi:hypothetical protein
MPRGYRCILVAFVGIVLAGASPPSQSDQNSGANANQTSAATATYQPYPDRYSERCYESGNHESADLCAQWRAAYAAEKTAGLSYWGNIISAVGALLSFASILLVLAALKQGREANQIARQESARAEVEADRARKHIINTERAFLKIGRMSANPVAENDAFIGVHLHMANDGKSNAWNIKVAHQIRFSRLFPARFIVSPPLALIALAEKPCTTPAIRLRKPKSFPAFVSGYVSYTTAQDANFRSFFIYRFDGLPVPDNYGGVSNQPVDVSRECELPSDT